MEGRERAETTVRLTLHTDFALRVLIQVGLCDGRLTTINDIAQTFRVSKAHLMKVVNDLSQKGYLETVRGRNGGIRLMREPRHINIGQVVRDTEDQLAVIGCLERRGYCSSSASACSAALCVMQPRHFWRFWMPILWLI